jgi:hypothetical protein
LFSSLNTTDAPLPAAIERPPNGGTLTTLANRNGWVNPEDLASMPQCIAQQDQSSWLRAMTSCTGRQCTRHFGVICTHHQYLTQLSCLSTAFSPDLLREYMPYCGRSVLAKSQLYRWIYTLTGRTWLVDVGDAIGLHDLSPAALVEGYAPVDVTDKAPMCLTGSIAASSMEPFSYVMTSCSFTSRTLHTGNTARPWEYSQQQTSMVALDSETAGYDLTHRSIKYGNYFDKRCFCDAFTVNLQAEPCSGPGLTSTQQRLWLHSTCGPAAVPANWTDGLMTTPAAYIPVEEWRWPSCKHAMPKKILRLADTCTTNACETDSLGYCNVKRAVERSCFCSAVSYESCKGACQVFEARIEYVKWLHRTCGKEYGWRGLPKHWRQLAAPAALDMIPWGWSVAPLKRVSLVEAIRSKSSRPTQTCVSPGWNVFYLVFVNAVTLLAGVLARRQGSNPVARAYARCFSERSWFLSGLAIITLHLLANLINATILQSTFGYEEIPILQLVLLWCSLPRLNWLMAVLANMLNFNDATFYTAASHIFAEAVLQAFSARYMIMTVAYGREHDFYSPTIAKSKMLPSAHHMYTGALIWLIITVVTIVLLLQALWSSSSINSSDLSALPVPVGDSKRKTHTRAPRDGAESSIAAFNTHWAYLVHAAARHIVSKTRDVETTPLLCTQTSYGTLPTEPAQRVLHVVTVKLVLIAVISMALLFVARCLFWIGFVGLGMEGYVFSTYSEVCVLTIQVLSAPAGPSYNRVGLFFGFGGCRNGRVIGIGIGTW